MPMTTFTKNTLRYWKKVAIQKHQLPPNLIEQFATGLDRGEFPLDQAGLVLLILGEGNARSTRPIVERYLTHDDPWLRYNALSALVLDWGLEDHRTTCIRMLQEDPDEDNRGMAARCLGSLYQATHDPETLRLLLQLFFNENEDKLVRESTYDAILDVVGISSRERPSRAKEWTWDTDINWKLLNDLQQKYGKSPGK